MGEDNGKAGIREVHAIAQRIEDKLDASLRDHEREHEKVDARIDKLNWRYYAVVAGLVAGLVGTRFIPGG